MALFTPLKTLLPQLTRHLRGLSAATSTFRASDVQITQCTNDQIQPKPDWDNLVFGKHFSDHMLEIEWTEAHGWGKPRIGPVRNFSIHPAAKVFHYSTELFEGMKAYRGVDNKIRLFRPDQNMHRMITTAERTCLPVFDGAELTELIKKLLVIDQEWVPYSTTSTLYIRPTMIGTEASLGVSKSNSCLLYVLCGPVGPYFPTGFKPVTLLADPQYVRAWKGGSGAFKMGSNYGPTIYVQLEAMKRHNCQQVLWLYGEDEQMTEVGTMNIFVYWTNEQGEKELVTPPLSSGIILPGVTRKSLIQLAQSWGEFKVSERVVTVKQFLKALEEGRVKEFFGAGTACIVCPVDKMIYGGTTYEVPTMSEGAPLTNRLLQELTDIQFGRKESEWSVLIE